MPTLLPQLVPFEVGDPDATLLPQDLPFLLGGGDDEVPTGSDTNYPRLAWVEGVWVELPDIGSHRIWSGGQWVGV